MSETTTPRPRILRGDDWAREVLRALGLEHTKNRRIIIDCEVGQPIKIYLENYGDERLWNVRMPPLEVVEIVNKSQPIVNAQELTEDVLRTLNNQVRARHAE